jgi:hypothetical protein
MNDNIELDPNQQIRRLAYSLWEQNGCPDGRDQEFWDMAEARFRRRNDGEHDGFRPTPVEPEDPHPADEDAENVYNPAPGGDTRTEEKDRSIDRLPKASPGSPA